MLKHFEKKISNIKDIKGPEIKLNTNKVSITEGTSVNWRSLIVSAIDNLDGDLTKYVGISGNVDMNISYMNY